MDSSIVSVAGFHLDCSKSQGHIFSRALRRVTCVLSRKGSATCAGTSASGGQHGRRRKKIWMVGKELVRHVERSKQLGAWQEHFKSWRYQLGLSSKNLFRQERHRVSGRTHGDEFLFAGLTERLTDFENKMTGVYPTMAKLVSYRSTESIKPLSKRLHWGKRAIVYQHDPRHVDVLVKNLGLQQGNSVQTPATHDVTAEEPEPLNQVQHSKYKSQAARCKMFVLQSRWSRYSIHRARVMSKDVKPPRDRALPN